MVKGIETITYPVKDIAKAKTLYSKVLGVEPYFDKPFYVGYKVNEQEIGLDPNGFNQGMTGPVVYWRVEDIHKSLATLLDSGAKLQQEVKDVGGGKLMARIQDTDDNTIGLIQLP